MRLKQAAPRIVLGALKSGLFRLIFFRLLTLVALTAYGKKNEGLTKRLAHTILISRTKNPCIKPCSYRP